LFSIFDAIKSVTTLLCISDKAAFEKHTLKLIHKTGELESPVKDKLISLANAIITGAKTGKAYAH
jgi:hypothetical protein